MTQASVLGPLLFVLYINDLADRVKTQVKLYTDDSKILAVIEDWKDANILQKDANCEWSKDWLHLRMFKRLADAVKCK